MQQQLEADEENERESLGQVRLELANQYKDFKDKMDAYEKSLASNNTNLDKKLYNIRDNLTKFGDTYTADRTETQDKINQLTKASEANSKYYDNQISTLQSSLSKMEEKQNTRLSERWKKFSERAKRWEDARNADLQLF